LQPNQWHFVLATWNPQFGILIFVDGPLVATSRKLSIVPHSGGDGVGPSSKRDGVEMQHHITIGRANTEKAKTVGSTHGKFSMEMIAVFNEYVPTGHVMLSYTYASEFN